MSYVKPQSMLERIFRAFEAELAHAMAVEVVFEVVNNIAGTNKHLDEVPNKRHLQAEEKAKYLEVWHTRLSIKISTDCYRTGAHLGHE